MMSPVQDHLCRAAAGENSPTLFNGTPVWVNITKVLVKALTDIVIGKGKEYRKVRSSNHFTFVLSKILIGTSPQR